MIVEQSEVARSHVEDAVGQQAADMQLLHTLMPCNAVLTSGCRFCNILCACPALLADAMTAGSFAAFINLALHLEVKDEHRTNPSATC